ncbi:serine/threonine protein kinase [Sclerotinia borealis F-4128]|uniref:Serine/threonine protein kinase n=1 Tax=Sclerotinia borealis (strain F-4128) TaxID=1432307 RepID=W9CBP2_SCLBF|nr:serine/threonine protein kinase [Sclerotinia borealis F-4128]
MASLLRLGQLLKGRASTNLSDQTVVIKSVRHFRLDNERDILKRFQFRTPSLRPLLDKIEDPSDPPALVLKHLDDDLLNASAAQRLTRLEIKHVAKCVQEALKVFHEDGYVHTDIKPDNVLVNYGQGDIRFADVELADCGSTVHVDSVFAKDRDIIGAPIWRSPEAQLQTGWGTPTDIWSFGTMISVHVQLITLIWGENWFIFKPDVPADHEEYELKILMKQHQFFGPFPLSYQEIADDETLAILTYIMHGVPPAEMKPFGRIAEREI